MVSLKHTHFSYVLKGICIAYLSLVMGCGSSGSGSEQPTANSPQPPSQGENPSDEAPAVSSESNYPVLVVENVSYADGLAYESSGTSPAAKPQYLDIYYPDNNATNRPVFVFIHGGGFTGGTKTKPEIVAMAEYFASRGWVFASIDYRTTEEMGSIAGSGMSAGELSSFYRGIAPSEWVEFTVEGAVANNLSAGQVQQGIAMYAAQRDAKAAVRWMVANSATYNINLDFVAVGGASAGAITAIALGISEAEDFRDEIPIADDATLSTANLEETYAVKSIVYFWGSNVKLEVFEGVYGLNRYDAGDPELFLAHGTNDVNPATPFSEATELKDIFDPLGVHVELVPLEGAGHGAWNATVDGKGLSELTFDFLVERQGLTVE